MKPDAAPTPDVQIIDRFLDGECSPAERAAFEGSLRTDATLRSAVDRRERFLSVLESAGRRDREDRLAAMPDGLDHRTPIHHPPAFQIHLEGPRQFLRRQEVRMRGTHLDQHLALGQVTQ